MMGVLVVLMGLCVHNQLSDFWVEFWVSVRNLCERFIVGGEGVDLMGLSLEAMRIYG